MTTSFIALLILLGFFNSADEVNNLSEQEQQNLIEIVIVDDQGL